MSVLAQRMHAQRLGSPAADVLAAVTAAGGLQAQDTAACRLSVRARTTGLTRGDVDRACAEGVVVRTWLMRSTLHMVPASDVHWLVDLLGPAALRKQRRRRLELGLTDSVCALAMELLPSILTGRALSRAEVVHELITKGVSVQPKGQAPAHLLFYAAMSGLICRGPELDRDEPSYVLLDEWVTRRFTPEDPLQELGRRYHQAFGPASAEDFAYWAGIPLGQARRVEPSSGDDSSSDVVRLLPAFDTYLLGYKERPVAAEFARRINAGGGWIHPTVVVDGRVVGVWHLRSGAVEVEPFEQLPDLSTEIADVHRFLR
jgi:DNA glycosylase AlkZ-like